ncbi:MAG: 16S rRNA (guanine(527)-N(7))-methyltransferase RsmG [Gammaproteobacteria bacterium]
MDASRRLTHGLEKMGISLDAETCKTQVQYLELIQKWNKVYNLTAITDLDQMVVRHLLDSLSILPFIDDTPILDVGTGAGLPGIPLALARPEYEFVLLDSNGKKTRFLTQVKIELDIDNIDIIHSRIEDYRPSKTFSIVTCRAFAEINTILERTQHLLTSETRILAMKGKQELPVLEAGFKQVDSHPLQVAWLNEERQLIEIRTT